MFDKQKAHAYFKSRGMNSATLTQLLSLDVRVFDDPIIQHLLELSPREQFLRILDIRGVDSNQIGSLRIDDEPSWPTGDLAAEELTRRNARIVWALVMSRGPIAIQVPTEQLQSVRMAFGGPEPPDVKALEANRDPNVMRLLEYFGYFFTVINLFFSDAVLSRYEAAKREQNLETLLALGEAEKHMVAILPSLLKLE